LLPDMMLDTVRGPVQPHRMVLKLRIQHPGALGHALGCGEGYTVAKSLKASANEA